MKSRYLIRLDDACPTMDRERWSSVEAMLDRHAIRPLVAVVPDNLDPELQVENPDPEFWEKVRRWEAKGWTIAMHGYQHLFHTIDRRELILPFYDRSEFGGLSLAEQSAKIRQSWALFQAQGISPTVWIAPAHCFDRTTLDALRTETQIRIVSDGIARDQYLEDGFHWLPQQLWSLVPRRSGLWTVCLHPNSMSSLQTAELSELIGSAYYRDRIFAVSDLDMIARKRNSADRRYAAYFWSRSHIVNSLLAMRRMVRPRPVA